MRDLFLTVLVAALLCAHPAVAEPPSTSGAADLRYGLDFRLTLDPAADAARASVTLKQDRHLLREASFRLAGKRWTDFSGDGSIERRGDRLVWQPPASGGTLRWEVALDHERGDAYDALLRPNWALFRGEDAFPTAATRTLEDAYSESTLTVRAPSGWSVITRYAEVENPEVENRFPVVNPDRRFDRPTGWIVAGDLGVRRDVIAGVHTVVAGPVDQGVRRLDMLALLAWTLPEFVRLIPDFPDRLTIVSAADPMWRGALSGPDSLYVHAGRPTNSCTSGSAAMRLPGKTGSWKGSPSTTASRCCAEPARSRQRAIGTRWPVSTSGERRRLNFAGVTPRDRRPRGRSASSGISTRKSRTGPRERRISTTCFGASQRPTATSTSKN
ncbi:MAG: hypothetical protein P8172_10300 [Gammaproteobacteria bacterium]